MLDAAIEVHRHLGPGYLERIYEESNTNAMFFPEVLVNERAEFFGQLLQENPAPGMGMKMAQVQEEDEKTDPASVE